MGVDAHARGGYVRCYGEVGKPEVLDVSLAKSAFYRLVEISAAKHRGHRIG